ncbi:MAG TPA: hypothetical protein VHL09_17025 [Dehalococcoidia bacterium]|nr:hypothetical protein [Dehalococcoidia bacterium]
MQTEIYESDPFSPKKGRLLAKLDTDYRFEKNDELFIHLDNGSVKIRIMHVRLTIEHGAMTRELLGLKL